MSDKLHFDDLTQITCPFGMLDDDTQKRLRACEEVLFYNCFGEWVKILEDKRIPCGPINNIKEAVESPQTKARNMIVSAMHNKIGEFKMAGNPIKMSSYKDESTRGEIPNLDQHREKILKEFGI